MRAKDEAGQALDATAALADMMLINDGNIDGLRADLEDLWNILSEN